MMPLVLVSITMGLLLALSPLASAGDSVSGPHYRIKARFDPARHSLAAEVRVERPPSATCYLHKDLRVQRVLANGQEVAFRRDEAAPPLPYVPAASAVVMEAKDLHDLTITYEGEVAGAVSDVNMIAPRLVELASYSAWYPIFQGLVNLTFEMQLEMPAGFVTVTNGVVKNSREEGGRCASVWESGAPTFDIVVLASPDLHTAQGTAGDVRVEMYYSRLPSHFMQDMRDALVQGMRQLSRAYGLPTGGGVLRFVCSPRAGWGYSRAPLFVVSEAYAEAELGRAHGEARQFHGYAHEMAHFWWMVADAATPDDWLNEGPAEYSAFRLSEVRDPAFVRVLQQEYREHAGASQTAAAVAETQASSPDRYVNRYEKTTLMFLEARRRFGEEALDRALQAIRKRSAGRRDSTTAQFLEEVRAAMGAEAEAFFRDALYRVSVGVHH